MVSELQRMYGRVRGRVQGVGFRYFVLRQARQFAVTGFVRNEPDGSVAVEAQGGAEDVRAFCDALRRGPALARVERVEVTPMQPVRDDETFRVL